MNTHIKFSFITILLISFSLYSNAQLKFKEFSAKKFRGENGMKIATGSVKISPEKGFYVYSDKAIINEKTSDFKAIGNVHVIKGESVNIYSETLDYDTKSGIGKFRKNVKLIDDQATLTTEFLDFNSHDNSGYFYGGAQIVDSASTLTSKKGYYYPKISSYTFVDSVVVHNEQYDLYSDTLKYDLITEVVSVYGPTKIISDENFIYCEAGWYDTKNDIAQVSQNSYMTNEFRKLSGDSLYYDRKLGIGKAFENIELTDFDEKIIIKGNMAYYVEKPEKAFVTDEAVFIQYFENSPDTMFLHADTLKSEYDTTGTYKILKAYKKAQVFKNDFQARADSIAYSLQDSTVSMFGLPTMWSDINQITSDFMKIFIKGSNLDHVEMEKNSFLISEEGQEKYNQIQGVNMKAYFNKNHLYRIDVDKDCNSIYYAKDEEAFIGMNKTKSTNMSIHLKNRQVKKVVFLAKPESTMYPIPLIPEDSKYLNKFNWLSDLRPKSKIDIFNWVDLTNDEKTDADKSESEKTEPSEQDKKILKDE